MVTLHSAQLPVRNPILFIVGPTASGKSAVALKLAKCLGGEIVSADSMQVYRRMDIGTAKPTRFEQKQIPHHLLSIVEPSQNFSVHQYRQKALKVLKAMKQRKKLPVVVGGSGLYVRALLDGLSPKPGASIRIRKRLEQEAHHSGIQTLYAQLQHIDPVRAKEIKPTDQKRIIRALEIYATSGKKPSELSGNKMNIEHYGFNPIVIGLTYDRPILYQRINQRVDRMFQKGLVKEVSRLSRIPLSRTAREAVGYKEIRVEFNSKNNKNIPIAKIKELVKLHTRRFAKRQWTWFKKERGIQWLNVSPSDSPANVSKRVLELICKSS